MIGSTVCPYEILGVNPKADDLQIRQAYRRLSGIYHPDRNFGATETVLADNAIKLNNVQEAYEILSDLQTKAEYDRKLFLKNVKHSLEKYNPFNYFFQSCFVNFSPRQTQDINRPTSSNSESEPNQTQYRN